MYRILFLMVNIVESRAAGTRGIYVEVSLIHRFLD